jgi:hypothetical protein
VTFVESCPTTKRKRLLLILAALLVVYVASYLALSRRGYAEARRWHVDGFYYFTPQDNDVWRAANLSCVVLFAPANGVGRLLGFGMPPGNEPLWALAP